MRAALRGRVVAAAVAAALAGCGATPGKIPTVDEGGGAVPAEAKLELPQMPQTADLVEVYPGPIGGHRYFIDARTLVVGQDRIVRFSMVVRTSGGATNITFEGIRCPGREKRLYAVGSPGKGWVEARRSEWEPIRGERVNEHHAFLYTEYFCPDGPIPLSKSSIVGAMRRGLSGHTPHRGDR